MPGYLWIMRLNRDQSGSYYWCACCFIKFPLRFAAWIRIICNNNYAVIDWLGLTLHLSPWNAESIYFRQCEHFSLILYTSRGQFIFMEQVQFIKFGDITLTFCKKNEVSLVILQRNENHPTNNIFEIRKHSLISKRIFQTNKKCRHFHWLKQVYWKYSSNEIISLSMEA